MGASSAEPDLPVRSSQGGKAASHPPFEDEPAFLAPVEPNTVRLAIFPVACWRLDDVRFEFDSSFVRPEARLELQLLAELVKRHPGAPLSVFGHADPSGDDEYNKQLSGRRAIAIYGLLTRDVALWQKLFDGPFGGDNWREKALGTMQETVGAKSASHAKLFRTYMDNICVDGTGQPFLVPKSEFLARGADPQGKGDFQGCGEFNPILLFSQEENKALGEPDRKAERDLENAPNRRVVVFLFRPDSKVTAAKWPCPRATETTAGCRKRFWSDGEKRRTPTAERRHYEDSQDTFACRFYDRIARGSPCEEGQRQGGICFVFVKLIDDTMNTVLTGTRYTLRGQESGFTLEDKTGDDGIIRHEFLPDDQFFLECKGVTEPVPLYYMVAKQDFEGPWFLRLRGFTAGESA